MSEGKLSSETKPESGENVDSLVQQAVNDVSHQNDVDRALDLPQKVEEIEAAQPTPNNNNNNNENDGDEFAELQQFVDVKPEDEQPPEENKEVIENLRNNMEDPESEEPPEENKEAIEALRAQIVDNENAPSVSLDPNDYTVPVASEENITQQEGDTFSVDPSDFVAKHGMPEISDPIDFINANQPLRDSGQLQNYFQQPPPCYSSYQPQMNFAPPMQTSPYYTYAQPNVNFQSQLPPMFTPQNAAPFIPPPSSPSLYSSAPNVGFFSPLGANNNNIGISPLRKSGNYVSDFTKNQKRSKGMKLFSDVFSRADKNDDGALFFEEFQSYFQDSVLDDDQLLNLFNTIDTSNTGMISLSELDEFFQQGFGQFQFLFDSLARLNTLVNQCLRATAKIYPSQSFNDQFRTRFFIKEFITQLTSINGQMLEARNSLENPIRFDQSVNQPKDEVRQTDSNLIDERTEDLRREVDRLSGLIDKLYDKRVQLEWDNKAIDFEEPEDYVILCRTFRIMPHELAQFDNSITKYYQLSNSEEGQLKFSIRRMPNQEIYRIIQIFENQDCYNHHKRSVINRNFLKEVIDYLEDPIKNDIVSIPKSWWKRNM